jgi:hypothetical protein
LTVKRAARSHTDGRFRGLAHCRRPDPPEAALEPCIQHVGRGAAAAIAFCDEPVDWFACDDDTFRSSFLALRPDAPWWGLVD